MSPLRFCSLGNAVVRVAGLHRLQNNTYRSGDKSTSPPLLRPHAYGAPIVSYEANSFASFLLRLYCTVDLKRLL